MVFFVLLFLIKNDKNEIKDEIVQTNRAQQVQIGPNKTRGAVGVAWEGFGNGVKPTIVLQNPPET